VSGSVLLTAAVAAAAAALAIPGGAGPATRRLRRLRPTGGRPPPLRAYRPDLGLLCVAAGAGVVVLWGFEVLLLGVTTSLVLRVALWLLEQQQGRRRARASRREVVEVCDALAAELRAGQPTVRALTRVAEGHGVLTPAARAAVLGGDVAAVLDRTAALPGATGLRAVAAAWRVAESTGAGLAEVLDRAAAALRADDAAAAEVSAALGPPRATAQLLAVLPAFGLLLGSGLGGDPVGFLTGSLPGQLCLAVGCGLAALGIWWVERLAVGVERRSA